MCYKTMLRQYYDILTLFINSCYIRTLVLFFIFCYFITKSIIFGIQHQINPHDIHSIYFYRFYRPDCLLRDYHLI